MGLATNEPPPWVVVRALRAPLAVPISPCGSVMEGRAFETHSGLAVHGGSVYAWGAPKTAEDVREKKRIANPNLEIMESFGMA